ncbi:hypothetical protein BO86DRAFT_450412 [Aspergillus japonicus CBS 114.51]|uniref:Mus7/MMS22 family-domain-containing protein n=1 Tax=Aspergillus japonicus CBS 114.51 TaxID=1448312 RepID=A0A8T8WRG2_ASPJA|nr:hypothetical protein BO86DRAFT_450412 [Aspergillus japonicus CBS 114.51]RAH78371.1 hypothetical protein BO86DRAFT_450412 [Aspergillus japonicus CBS 114.51]
MESWRERGFVPDSDSEDGFDSQETLNSRKDDERAVESSAAAAAVVVKDVTTNTRVAGAEGRGTDPLQSVNGRDPAHPSTLDFGVEEGPMHILPTDESTVRTNNAYEERPREQSVDETTPRAGGILAEVDKVLGDAPRSASSTPRAKGKADTRDDSSSEDELQFEYMRPRKPVRVYTRVKSVRQSQPAEENYDSSTPSSPLSSLDSLRLDFEDEEDQGNNAADNDLTQQEEEASSQSAQELPPLDIPEELLRELSQPARRSLRERKAIQLHPYMLEDVKYRNLMRARGVKPVRVAQQEINRSGAQESQNQDYVDQPEPMSDSLGAEFEYLPSSPPETRLTLKKRSIESSPERQHHQAPRAQSTNRLPGPTIKRRKVSKIANPQQTPRTETQARLQVVIDNGSSPARQAVKPIFDIPSPPRSEDDDPSDVEPSTTFRFPKGYTPALNTPSTGPRAATTDRDVMDWSAPEIEGSMDDGHLEAAPSPLVEEGSQASSEEEREETDGEKTDEDEAAIRRRYQRRIKGQKQKEVQFGSTQRSNEKMRVLKHGGNARLPGSIDALRQLADSDSEDGREAKEADEESISRPQVARQGDEYPSLYEDMDDDIPEDNRIDEMFPPVPRSTSGLKARKQGKKKTTVRTNAVSSTRLTDRIYRTQKQEKRRAPALPKLGVLDAPDFLRDKGRRNTEDANASLHQWRAGNFRQTRLPRIQTKPFKQQTTREGHAKTQDRVGINEGRAPVRTLASSLMSSYLSRDSREHGVRVEDHPPDQNSTIPPQRPNDDQVSRETGKPEQPSNRWIVKRNFAVTSLTRNGFRPAMLEEVNPAGRPVSPVSFQRSLSQLNRDYRGKSLPRIRRDNVVMDRFIASRSSTPVPAEKSNQPATAQMVDKSSARRPLVQTRLQSRQVKKRPPRRLEINTIQEQEPLHQETITMSDSHWASEEPQPSSCPVGALEGLQRTYPIDFNITPLVSGTFFHESTFIGSGEFCRSLKILTRNLDNDAGFFTLHLEDERHRWGAWNDAVSSGLGLAFDKIVEELDRPVEGPAQSLTGSVDKQGCMVYRSLVKYVTDILSFIDPIDRTGFVRRAHSLVSKVNDTLATLVPTTEPEMDHLLTISAYNTVFVNMLLQIAGHELVEGSVADEVVTSLKLSSKLTIAVIASELGQSSIRKHLQDLESTEARERGIRSGRSSLQAYVTVRHVLRSNESMKGYFEDLLTQAYTLADEGDVSNSKNVSQLETAWRNVFTSLPLNEFDVRGIAQIGSRFREQQDNWPVIKMLLRPALESYEASSVGQPVLYYIYCRALFHRCFHLINGWGWRDCKQVLDTLYDFFAKNTLYNLRQEESYKSPSFLNELDRNPSLHVQPGEPCFHILLKIIASGLKSLSKSYDKKKVRNFAWRLLPNHGRMYPKEKPIQQTDLDALRNHHDLLCTLYYAVPDGCRPRLETIRDLVHPASSHRETCNISLRSWDRLVRFKLSADEEVSGLEPFADWHCYFVTELLKQHAMARQEVEAQNTVANKFSDQLVEKTIAQNQRQIESLLKTALSNLKSAVKAAPTLQHAQKLVSKMPVKALLGLFNPQLARVNIIVTESLLVILAYLEKCNASQAQAPGTAGPPVVLDEDSQEYGDWTDIEAVCGAMTTTAPPEIEYVEQTLHPAVSRLVSNCFGEDYCPEDAILLSAVECWTSIAQTLVKHGLRHWDSYLTPYNGDSWAALRSTMQTRKFTPFFLASCIEKDARCIVDCKVQILGMWMASLVERVALLKYQHRLTEALLNHEEADPVLQNLPFAIDRKQGRYSLSLEDISQRRLSLISSLLSNMRSHLQDLEDAGAREYSSTKQEYAEAIQRMMSSMKANYQELGNGTQSVQGAYVDLVHRVVGFLQQHSRQICPIDPFFIDPASFPLPSTDPTYIVARLKSYEPKVPVESGAKTLVVFVQSVSERAAIDGQQDYLVNQLHSSMSETYESGSPDKPTLRSTMLQAVFPAYLETAFSSRAAWVLSRPIVHTIRLVFKELLFTFDSTDAACVGSVLNMFACVFGPSYRALQLPLFRNVNLLTDPAAATSAASFWDMITSALPIVDYIDRGTTDHRAASDNILLQLRAFRQLALVALSISPERIEEQPHLPAAIPPGGGDFTQHAAAFTSYPAAPTTPSFFPELRHGATRELQSYIYENWSCHQGKYYFTRRGGHQPQEVEVEPAVAAQLEQSPLLALRSAAQSFLDTLGKLGLIEDDADDE